jgi:eukaryotic-like serine/threonine-protein kinase
VGTQPGSTNGDHGRVRFGPFEMDLGSAELWSEGRRVRLQLQPFKVLALLVSRPGELVSREEIRQEVWPDGTYVDFEPALNFCIRQIRAALGDQVAQARYVETLPRRGYRFIAPVEPVGGQPAVDAVPPAPRVEEPASHPPPRTRTSARARGPAAVLALVAVAAGAAYLAAGRTSSVPAFHRLTFRRGSVWSARFAPDGQVVFMAAWEGGALSPFLGHVTARDSRPLDLAASRIFAVSRAGEVAFRGPGGVLSRARLAGGPVKQVLESVVAADWRPDGTDFAVARRDKDGAVHVEFPVATVLGPARWPSHLRLSPDGRHVAFLEHPVAGDDRGAVVTLDRSGGRRVLTPDWASIEGLAWSPGGHEVWFTAAREGADSALHAVDLQGHVRTVFAGPGRLVLHDIAADGRALVERNTLREEIRFRGARDDAERDLSWLDLSRAQDLSADGAQLLIAETGEGGGPDYGVFLRRTDGSVPVRVGSGQAQALSPDGAWALAVPIRDRTRLELLPTGPGEVRWFRAPGGQEFHGAAWRPDGRAIVYAAGEPGGRLGLFVQDLAGGEPRSLTPRGVAAWVPAVSPDGRGVVAYDGRQWLLHPLDAGGEPRPLAVPEGKRPFGWADAGTLYLRTGEVPVVVEQLDVATGRLTPWKELAPADRAGVLAVAAVRIASGGAAYAYSYHRRLSDLYVLDGLR